ncbi:hypothetical protein MASR2M17_18760 [Aminivibrio sp.]
MTSSELAELRSICDRIVIVAKAVEGCFLDASDADFGLMMSGSRAARRSFIGGETCSWLRQGKGSTFVQSFFGVGDIGFPTVIIALFWICT